MKKGTCRKMVNKCLQYLWLLNETPASFFWIYVLTLLLGLSLSPHCLQQAKCGRDTTLISDANFPIDMVKKTGSATFTKVSHKYPTFIPGFPISCWVYHTTFSLNHLSFPCATTEKTAKWRERIRANPWWASSRDRLLGGRIGDHDQGTLNTEFQATIPFVGPLKGFGKAFFRIEIT